MIANTRCVIADIAIAYFQLNQIHTVQCGKHTCLTMPRCRCMQAVASCTHAIMGRHARTCTSRTCTSSKQARNHQDVHLHKSKGKHTLHASVSHMRSEVSGLCLRWGVVLCPGKSLAAGALSSYKFLAWLCLVVPSSLNPASMFVNGTCKLIFTVT